jgi:hypothetical protein
MGEQVNALRALIRQRHMSYEAFCREWDRVAKSTDEALRGHYPGRAQYYRWLRGELTNNRPYPDACRMLEAMFPGWSVERLFSPFTGEIQGLAGHPGSAEMAAPEVRISPLSHKAWRIPPSELTEIPSHVIDLSGHPSNHAIHPHSPRFGHADISPVLGNMSRATALPAISAIREIHRGYLIADRMMGGLSVTSAVQTQIPVIEMACEVSRGADRTEALEFACRFMEFCGWVHQDAGDLICAMYWTDRALDYAMELGKQRIIAYTLMRKASITTEAGNPAQGLGIVNFALSSADALTPRLRAVILRQRAYANAALREVSETERDSENAINEAIDGVSQGEEDRAPYCTPAYVAMETGQSMVIAGHPEFALPALARASTEWSDDGQARDHALCASRLAMAYAVAGHPERACAMADEAINLASGIGSLRVVSQLKDLSRVLGRWRDDPVISDTQERLNALIESFRPGIIAL